jgi:hypothetical protein
VTREIGKINGKLWEEINVTWHGMAMLKDPRKKNSRKTICTGRHEAVGRRW